MGGYVKLRGLKGASERNGQVGVVKEWDAGTERYTVSLRDGTLLKVRRGNLLQMVDVTLVGLDGDMAQHNGAVATVFDFVRRAHLAPHCSAPLRGLPSLWAPVSLLRCG